MVRSIQYLLLFSGLAILFAFASPEKRIEKIVARVWKDTAFTISDVQLPDSMKSNYKYLKEVKINDTTAGYVCYTTAFGCRIGGCAAPSTNTNVQAYETFDYIVIYDTSLQILKVDIAQYSGDYGFEICNTRWLKQFIGSNSGFKLNENIDGIVGATVSVSYLIDDLNAVGQDLSKVLLNKAKENC